MPAPFHLFSSSGSLAIFAAIRVVSSPRSFPAGWMSSRYARGFKVLDANGQALACAAVAVGRMLTPRTNTLRLYESSGFEMIGTAPNASCIRSKAT